MLIPSPIPLWYYSTWCDFPSTSHSSSPAAHLHSCPVTRGLKANIVAPPVVETSHIGYGQPVTFPSHLPGSGTPSTSAKRLRIPMAGGTTSQWGALTGERSWAAAGGATRLLGAVVACHALSCVAWLEMEIPRFGEANHLQAEDCCLCLPAGIPRPYIWYSTSYIIIHHHNGVPGKRKAWKCQNRQWPSPYWRKSREACLEPPNSQTNPNSKYHSDGRVRSDIVWGLPNSSLTLLCTSHWIGLGHFEMERCLRCFKFGK